jgi:hypothetical protein
MEWHSWIRLKLSQVLKYCLSDFLQVLWSVFVFGRFYAEVNFVVRQVRLVETVLFWHNTFYLLSDCKASFIQPASRHIMHGVPATA